MVKSNIRRSRQEDMEGAWMPVWEHAVARTLAVLIGVLVMVCVRVTADPDAATMGFGQYEAAMQPPVDHGAAIKALSQVRRDEPGQSLWCLERLVPLYEKLMSASWTGTIDGDESSVDIDATGGPIEARGRIRLRAGFGRWTYNRTIFQVSGNVGTAPDFDVSVPLPTTIAWIQ